MKPSTDWQTPLGNMIKWLKEDKPFCYLRFADGEFNAMFNPKESEYNADGHRYFGDLGEALFYVLKDITQLPEQPPNLLVGGHWLNYNGIDQGERLKAVGFLDKIRWCPSNIIIDGIQSLKSLELLKAIIESKRKKALICNERINAVTKVLNADWVSAPAKNCWMAKDTILEQIKWLRWVDMEEDDPELLIFCIGMASEPIMWQIWKQRPDSILIDMGHFFDGAFGVKSRAWLCEDNPRLKVYNEKYVSVIKGEKCESVK